MKSKKKPSFQKLEPQNTPVEAGVIHGLKPSGQSPEAFNALLPDALQDQYLVVPAEQVALHVLDLPIRSARQRREAIPFALEEAVGQPLDQVHFAICESLTDGRLLVAVVDRTHVARHLEDAPHSPLIAEQMLLAAPVRDNAGQLTWRAYRENDRVLVRAADGTGFAARADMLPFLWRAAGTPAIECHGAALPDGMTAENAFSDVPPPPTGLDRYDLRQGAYRPSRGLERPLRWLAASVVLAVFAHLGLAAADVRAQREIADTLGTAAASALTTRLPAASVDDNPALLLRQIAAQSGRQRGSAFLPLMNQVSQVWLREGTAVQIRQLSWADDALRLVVEAPDLEALQLAEASLSSNNLNVSSGSATADAGSARAELMVRP